MRQTPSPAAGKLRRPARGVMAALALAATLTLATGCLYRMPILQGNYPDPSQVVKLQAGMTKSQVRFLLGTPMLPNGFNSDRWNYFYYEKIGNRTPVTMHVTVFFKDDKVDHFERPDNTEAAAAAMAASNEAAMAKPSAPVAAPRSTMPTVPVARPEPSRH
jgi:outer membrane protein assembly factor BamE (lipoprotein component of BamABCDE complex)